MTLAPDEVPLQSGLVGLAAEISARQLQGHLVNRAPEVVDPTSPYFPLVVDHLKGIAAEVTAIVGTTPTGARRARSPSMPRHSGTCGSGSARPHSQPPPRQA